MAESVPVGKKLSFRTKFCYGVGHILNDLCASMWFTYLLVYLHRVINFSNTAAGTLLLIGQVTDAICTPIVGIESDKTGDIKYGRRKIWHLVGVLCVACSFPFIFNLCIHCDNSSEWARFMYYVPFIMIFQFGWASTQISHLALIPELTDDDQEKCTLNAIRYAATVVSNIFVFVVTWVILEIEKPNRKPDRSNHSQTPMTKIDPTDATVFMYVVLIIVGTGILFMVIFHVGVREPRRPCTYNKTSVGTRRSAFSWTKWFKEIQFYQIAVLYMCTRLIVNVTQVYLPLFALETLSLEKHSIAILPLVVYVSGFVSTFISKPSNEKLGRKLTFFLGLLLIIGTCCWANWLKSRNEQVYGVVIMLGVGGSTLLVTALTMTADLIADNVETSAFVYGAMSFVDKLSNGIAIQVIQVMQPCNAKGKVCCDDCRSYYRDIMVYVAGGAALVALIALLTLLKTKIGAQLEVDQKGLNVCSSLINGSTSQKPPCPAGVMCSKAPYIPCESPAPCKYGAIERKRTQSFTGSIQESLDDPDRICVMNGRASRAQAVES